MSIEAMKQMVEALEMPCNYWNKTQFIKVKEAIEIGRKAIAEAEKQEPVAEVLMHNGEKIIDASMAFFDSAPIGTVLYTHPQPKREWVGLTESDRRLINFQWQDGNGTATEIIDLVEAKLKEKNT